MYNTVHGLNVVSVKRCFNTIIIWNYRLVREISFRESAHYAGSQTYAAPQPASRWDAPDLTEQLAGGRVNKCPLRWAQSAVEAPPSSCRGLSGDNHGGCQPSGHP